MRYLKVLLCNFICTSSILRARVITVKRKLSDRLSLTTMSNYSTGVHCDISDIVRNDMAHAGRVTRISDEADFRSGSVIPRGTLLDDILEFM
jgi:hypothetical protein